MLKDKAPKRGSFDYLLDGNSIHDDPPPPIDRGRPGRIRIDIEIVERRHRAKENRAPSMGFVVLWALLFLVILVMLRGH